MPPPSRKFTDAELREYVFADWGENPRDHVIKKVAPAVSGWLQEYPDRFDAGPYLKNGRIDDLAFANDALALGGDELLAEVYEALREKKEEPA